MKGFAQDIEGLTVKNDEFRRVLYTAKHRQLVVMSLKHKVHRRTIGTVLSIIPRQTRKLTTNTSLAKRQNNEPTAHRVGVNL